MVKKVTSIGILGMLFAVAGGIVWYFQQRFLGLLLWGVAVIIILKLNKEKKKTRKSTKRPR
ncbi:hypothetical protein [Nitrososphaera sp. AFS]|uniref:hypothetical protein n=1 Tax=Nitrososphaera sp. AFS TaxID=2301191 RepID=UPI0013923859|nr:hypothetical protein [Nitrososphaera sp. AFS]NAL77444.1 hypothetical protein [Nitrososphaera sp. AFS]